MPRPKRIRRITEKPAISGFKPYGETVHKKRNEAIFLLYEEYEALRLCDYDNYNQCDAAALMNISRPTLTRIYISARRKIAQAMVEGRQLIIEGGKVEIDKEWMECNDCHCYFLNMKEDDSEQECPLCGSKHTHIYHEMMADEEPIRSEHYRCCHGGRCHGRKNKIQTKK